MYKSCIFMRFSTIFTVRSLKKLFELLRSLLLISLMSGPLKIWFCQFAQSASLFVSRSAIAPKIKVRSRAKSERAISKSDVPSSGKWIQGNLEIYRILERAIDTSPVKKNYNDVQRIGLRYNGQVNGLFKICILILAEKMFLGPWGMQLHQML